MKREELYELPEMEALSELQKRFVVAYCLDTNFNAAEAVRVAGYKTAHSHKMGSEIANKPHVSAAISAVSSAVAEKNTALKPEYALRKLKKALETAEEEGKLSEMLRATELLMKHLGMFKEQVELSGKNGEAIKMEKVAQNVQSFTSTIARLAERGREREASGDTLQ